MEPFKASKLPIQYNLDKELLSLISEANERYSEYKSYKKNSNLYIYQYQEPKNHITCDEFYKYIETQKLINI